MKIVHSVSHIDHASAGPSYTVPSLCRELAARGHDVEITCLAAGAPIEGVRIERHTQWPFLRQFAISWGHGKALRRSAATVDIVHNHSLWSMVNISSGWIVPGHAAKLVVSPRGTLSPWALARSRAIKRVLWPVQQRMLFRADMLHATSESEYENIRALGVKAPVAVIPNGVDIPARPKEIGAAPQRTLLFLSRVHPTKGIDLLLRAWAAIQDFYPDWRFEIVGPDEVGHEQIVKQLAESLRVKRVAFRGALHGKEKAAAYFSADLFALPTHTENFGMVVAEALAHGCPVIVSKGAPWAGVESHDCGWWIENTTDELERSLHKAMSLPKSALAAMGERGRAWMDQEYAWAPIAGNMEAAYAWLIGGGDTPYCVRLA